MASKLSADIAQKIDITARKNDSFYLQITLTNTDGTIYDIVSVGGNDYVAYMEVYNANDEMVLGFNSLSSSWGSGYVASQIITVVGSTAVLTIDSPATNMTLRVGSYKYKLYVTESTDAQTNTVMYGKFKVIDL